MDKERMHVIKKFQRIYKTSEEKKKALEEMEDKDIGFFALGLLSQNLENIGIETAIEKNINEKDEYESSTSSTTTGSSSAIISSAAIS